MLATTLRTGDGFVLTVGGTDTVIKAVEVAGGRVKLSIDAADDCKVAFFKRDQEPKNLSVARTEP